MASLEHEFDTAGELEVPGLGARPLVVPADEAELCAALRFASREGLRVLPVGRGSKLDWMPRPERVDFALSTSALAGVVAYEPGDGTLTALAGSRLDELAATVAAGGHHLTPDVAGAARGSLGGVLATGRSGWDRAALGPLRHHVLGLRVALADGRVVRSGGRLVKNVTGFDVHRLHLGGYGAFGVVLEASLRLFPAHEERFVLAKRCADADAGLALAERLDAERLTPFAVELELASDAPCELTLVLGGRAEPTAWQRDRVLELAPDAEVLAPPDADARIGALRERDHAGGRWSELVVHCLPSHVASVVARTRAALPGARLFVRPGVAEVLVRASESTDVLRAELVRAGTHVHARGAGSTSELPAGPAAALAERLRATLDPAGILAGRAPVGAPREGAPS